MYEATGDEGYLDIIKKNIDASPETISFVSILSYCKPCQRLYNILVDVYINNSNKVNRSTAVMGILYNKGIIKQWIHLVTIYQTVLNRKQVCL